MLNTLSTIIGIAADISQIFEVIIVVIIIAIIFTYINTKFKPIINIEISSQGPFLLNGKKCINVNITLNNDSNIKATGHLAILTVFILKKDFINYLYDRGTKKVCDFIPIEIKNKEELEDELNKFLEPNSDTDLLSYINIKKRCSFKKYKLKKQIISKIKEDSGISKRKITCNDFKDYIIRQKMLKRFLNQYEIEDAKELKKFLYYIIEIKSEEIFMSTVQVFPKEKISNDRVFILEIENFIQLGVQMRTKGIRKTSTRILGLNV